MKKPTRPAVIRNSVSLTKPATLQIEMLATINNRSFSGEVAQAVTEYLERNRKNLQQLAETMKYATPKHTTP